jgi:hypothetical protein
MSSKNSRPKLKPVMYNKFQGKNLSFTELEKKSERNASQWICFPRYKYSSSLETNFVFQTPEMEVTQYGVPRIGEYYKSDEQRSFLKLALDPNQPSCVELGNMLKDLDTAILKHKTSVLKKYAKIYKYQPIFREPQVDDTAEISDDEDEDEEKEETKKTEQRERFNYFKVKMDTKFPERDQIRTLVFRKTVDKAGKTTREKLDDVATMSDLEKYVRLGSKVRLVLMANKLWASKNKDSAGNRKFGVTLKVLQMEVECRESQDSVRKEFENDYNFNDDDLLANEEEETNDAAAAESNDELDEEADEAEEDDELDDEADEEDEEDEEDDEDDEDDDEEEEEDEEPEPPVKKTSKKVKTKTKKTKTKSH